MKTNGRTVLLFVGLCVAASAASAAPRGSANGGLRPECPWAQGDFQGSIDPGLDGLYAAAAVDTYLVVWYDFEDMSWQGWNPVVQMRRAGLARNLMDDDPCNENFSTQIAFFLDSPAPRRSALPYRRGPFSLVNRGVSSGSQSGLVISPTIDLNRCSTQRGGVQDRVIPTAELSRLGGCRLRFTVHVDLPYEESIFFVWHIRNIENGKAGAWFDRGFLYYGGDTGYQYFDVSIGDLATSDSIQIALGVCDMRSSRYFDADPLARLAAPLRFDNVRIERYVSAGPQWSYRDIDLFQDNFPSSEDNIESCVRADMANDINPDDNPVIRPGDSVVVSCDSPRGGGIASENGLPAVYLHVKCTYVGVDRAKPKLSGAVVGGNYGRYVSDDGTWTVIQGEPARSRPGRAAIGKWMFDLNDSLFTRGYKIEYYFSARDNASVETTLPRWARSYGPCFEFTCLPTKNSDILFVDDFSGRGSFFGAVQDYWSPAFAAVVPPNNQPDRYDVNGPASGVSNGPGSRAKNKHLICAYSTIIWDCGDLDVFTITDGTSRSDKSDDCRMLLDWMNGAVHRTGLWICGDDVAQDLERLTSVQARILMRDRCGVSLVNPSYFRMTGGIGGGVITPIVTGDGNAGIFIHSGVPDKFYIFGGCLLINRFDVLDKTAHGEYALRYPDAAGKSRYAGVASSTSNSQGFGTKTMWFGFSYMYIRDDVMAGAPDRFELLRDVLNWLERSVDIEPTRSSNAAEPLAYGLANNYPNPFNPSTTIRYTMKERGLVTIKVYDVAGRLVKTLLDEVRDAGEHAALWDGTNNRGGTVSSGIYFYEMRAKGFGTTKKMILLH
jgi:hypothetical protein